MLQARRIEALFARLACLERDWFLVDFACVLAVALYVLGGNGLWPLLLPMAAAVLTVALRLFGVFISNTPAAAQRGLPIELDDEEAAPPEDLYVESSGFEERDPRPFRSYLDHGTVSIVAGAGIALLAWSAFDHRIRPAIGLAIVAYAMVSRLLGAAIISSAMALTSRT